MRDAANLIWLPDAPGIPVARTALEITRRYVPSVVLALELASKAVHVRSAWFHRPGTTAAVGRVEPRAKASISGRRIPTRDPLGEHVL